MVSEKEVMGALKECTDPEIGISLVDLGLIYGVEVKGDRVKIRMTLTSMGCPLADMIRADVREKAGKLEGVKAVEVEMVWEPPWTPERISPEARKRLGV